MTTKCSICNENIEKTFLDKIIGTYIKKGKKLEAVCSNCQRKKAK
ncbi:MAG TPA: hypothetical protein VJG30_03655 [Candidatus Nanoarchaeia archaeon]|nr:hypothetical protein [Candidatus Nanoarchaeia archaeon]